MPNMFVEMSEVCLCGVIMQRKELEVSVSGNNILLFRLYCLATLHMPPEICPEN